MIAALWGPLVPNTLYSVLYFVVMLQFFTINPRQEKGAKKFGCSFLKGDINIKSTKINETSISHQ